MAIQIDLFDLLYVLMLLLVFIERIKMSASSNLKDAVVSLQNSNASLVAAATLHIASDANALSEADAQLAADAINGVAVSVQQVAVSLAPKV